MAPRKFTCRATVAGVSLLAVGIAGCGGDAVVSDPPPDHQPCTAEPSCDPGDSEVTTCPPGVACYDVSECATTITCQDEFPEHGCPTDEPTNGTDCTGLPDMLRCTYSSGYDCWKLYVCEPVHPEAGAPSRWRFDGEVCAG